MTRLIKWGGMGVGGLALLAVLVVLVLPSLVNLGRYRTVLAQRVGRALGREVSFGALRVSVWGGLGAEAKSIQIGQASDFGREPFLSAEALRVHVQLLPLLRGQVRVTSAVLERPRIRLIRRADGRWNVDDLFKTPTPQGPPRAPSEPPRPGKAALFGGLFLSEVAVRNGEVTLVEQPGSAASSLGLADVDLTIRQSAAADAIDVRSRARLFGSASGQVETAVRVRPGEKDGASVDGTVSFTDVNATNWQALVPSGGDGPLVSGPVSGEVRLAGPLARTTFAGSLNLRPTTVRLGHAFRKPAGEDARITFQGQRENAGLRLTNVTVTVRDTTLEGTVHLPDVQRPRIIFTAASPRMNLDRLLAVPQQRAWWRPGVAWAAEPRAKGSASTVSGLSVQGRVSIADLTYQGMAWSDVEAGVQYDGGVLRLPDVRANLAEGTLRANGELDLRPKTPRVILTSRLERAAAAPLVKALAPGAWTLTSDLDLDGQWEFTGVTWPEAAGSLVGSGSLQLRNGRLSNYRPLERLAEVASPVLAAQGVHVRWNEFDQVSGHYTVERGLLRTTDLTLTKPEGTVIAAGTVGLLDSALDFDVVAKFGRATIEAKVTGTTAQPIVVPKLARFQQRIEKELDKALPAGQSQGLKNLLKGLLGK